MSQPNSTPTPARDGRVSGGFGRLLDRGEAVLTQAGLHGQLVWVDWLDEKARLLRMLLIAVLGFATLQALLLSITVLVMALSWNSLYRLVALTGLTLVFATTLVWVWHRLRALAALGMYSFADSRRELATDLALLRRP